MRDLKELELTLVISTIRYINKNLNELEAEQKAKYIMAKSGDELYTHLKALVEEIGKNATRRSLLDILVDNIRILHSVTHPIKSVEADQISQSVTFLLSTIQRLESQGVSTKIQIEHNGTARECYGLGAYTSSKGRLGALLEELILKPLRIYPGSSEERIREQVQSLVDDHQMQAQQAAMLRRQVMDSSTQTSPFAFFPFTFFQTIANYKRTPAAPPAATCSFTGNEN